jgi:glycosyltransferase involved in cell wall biosynthesis
MVDMSVIIPTYNRVESLRNCLEALVRQTQSPEDFEVIVVVDGSTDGTNDLLENFEAPYLLRHLRQENTGQPGALNRGISEANGQFCLFIDDDIIADPNLVAEHLRAQCKNENLVAVGQITMSVPSNADWYLRSFAKGWLDHYERLNQGNGMLTWEDCYSGNLSVPRDALRNTGGFSTEIIRSYDVELAWRLENEGFSFIYLANAVGCQQESKNFHELSRDTQNAGMVDFHLYMRNPRYLTNGLASFPDGSWRKILLRRLLLSIPIPLKFLYFFGKYMIDLDRKYAMFSFLQNISYWRGVKKAASGSDMWNRITSGTPVLMYHAVGSSKEKAGAYIIKDKKFKMHINWIKRLGYKVISIDQLMGYRQSNQFPHARTAIITFDDGYLDNYTLAEPALLKHSLPATIFLVSDYVGKVNEWDKAGQLAGRPLMNWSQVIELSTRGVKFGSHTCTHMSLKKVLLEQAYFEITFSKEKLESRINADIQVLAYPYGEYDIKIQKLVEQAGYTAGFTIEPGLNGVNSSALALKRTEIQGTDSFVRLWLALWFGDAEAILPRRKTH